MPSASMVDKPPRSQGLSSSRPLELQNVANRIPGIAKYLVSVLVDVFFVIVINCVYNVLESMHLLWEQSFTWSCLIELMISVLIQT